MAGACSSPGAPRGAGSSQSKLAPVTLNRAFRLRKGSDFQRVRQQGRSIASRLLILAWVPNEARTSRVGFVVSKRISKYAVRRNYIKRLLGEAIRPYITEMRGGWDIVLSARQPVVAADLSTLQREIVTLLQRARLLAPPANEDVTQTGAVEREGFSL
jgi:ribonuclease P protein component